MHKQATDNVKSWSNHRLRHGVLCLLTNGAGDLSRPIIIIIMFLCKYLNNHHHRRDWMKSQTSQIRRVPRNVSVNLTSFPPHLIYTHTQILEHGVHSVVCGQLINNALQPSDEQGQSCTRLTRILYWHEKHIPKNTQFLFSSLRWGSLELPN